MKSMALDTRKGGIGLNGMFGMWSIFYKTTCGFVDFLVIS